MKKKEYTIPSEYNAVGEICKEIREDFVLKLGEKNSREIEICLVEALNNIIKHAYEEDSSKKIGIELIYDGKSIIIELRDTGISRKEFRKPKLEFDPDDIENLPEGGMGLYIIDQLMDEIAYHTENEINIFQMKKFLN